MRKCFCIAALFCLAALSRVADAQSFDFDNLRLPIAQVDSAWRFQLGDDADGSKGWAQAGFDDSSWPVLHPGDDWTTQGYPTKTELGWFRFHLRFPAHVESMAIDMPQIDKSYQIFCDGRQIGQVGTLPPGPARNVVGGPRVFTLPVNSGAEAKSITVALRVWQDPATAGSQGSSLYAPAYVGSAEAVEERFAADRAEEAVSIGENYTENIVILTVGAAIALLFWLTRERCYLWFACHLLLQSSLLVVSVLSELQAWTLYFTVDMRILIDILSLSTYSLFIVSALYPDKWKRAVLPIAMVLLGELSIVLILIHVIPLKWGDIGYGSAIIAWDVILAWYLLRGWGAGSYYARLFFFPFAIEAFANILDNVSGLLRDLKIHLPVKIAPIQIIVLREPFLVRLVDLVRMGTLLGMLAVLVYRFARTTREQQRLSAALKAAHDIQNRLVPVDIPILGGLQAEITYRAAEEVGGDFCQILPRPDGSIFVAIGDVSGKGLQAAMLGAVAVGALRSLADEEIGPGAALERLNNILLRTENAGFITCLCLILGREGEIVMANAGHLSPYLNGEEVALEAGLPLGIVSGVQYDERSLLLPDSSRLTLISDGVVEARSASGELFGFERTTQISRFSASEIAARACEFGQEDDITVITLDWQSLGVGVVMA